MCFLDQAANGNNEMQALANLLLIIAKSAIQIADIVSLGHIAGRWEHLLTPLTSMEMFKRNSTS